MAEGPVCDNVLFTKLMSINAEIIHAQHALGYIFIHYNEYAQMCLNPLLKTVPNKCTIYSCLMFALKY